MRNGSILLLITSLAFLGCNNAEEKKGPSGSKSTPPAGASDASPKSTGDGNAASDDQKSDSSTAAGTTIPLSPDNTVIEFVGTHKGEKPDPRTGRFDKFTGELRMRAENSPEAIMLEIETASLTTEISKLTDHLKSEDFFEVNQFPTASFKSTKIDKSESGHQVVGDLTLHGVTKEISFPATVETTDGKPGLKSEFTIDRTQFGMNFGLDNVEEEVVVKVTVYGNVEKQ